MRWWLVVSGGGTMEVMNRSLRVQSSTFWDHVNIVDIVMQVIGILSSYICFVRRHLTILGAKPLPLKFFKNDTLTM